MELSREVGMQYHDFHHPYTPYRIQLQLMQQIYDLLESDKKLGIFESPTGTGKTLSLICSTVTWLREHKAEYSRLEEGGGDKTGYGGGSEEEEEPSWVRASYAKSVLGEKARQFKDYEEYLGKLDTQPIFMDKSLENVKKAKKRRIGQPRLEVALDEGQDVEFVLDAYHSDSEDVVSRSGLSIDDKRSKLDSEIKALLHKIEGKDDDDPVKSIEINNPLKIYFTSRTHSQLIQFASQMRLPKFPPSFSELEEERIKFLPFGSRKQLCIHEKVSKLKSNVINDGCMHAVNKKECTHYLNARDPRTAKQFRDYTFSAIHDIEDLLNIGKTLNACPYYSSREFVSSSEVISLPYQHLLLEEARNTLGIELKDAIIIIDEAHNLIDTINSLYSASVSLVELKQCRLALKAYLAKFKTRLNSGNRVNILKLNKMIDVLIQYIESNYKNGKQIDDPNEIFMNTNADIINIHKLNKYMKVSKIAFKVDSYIQAATQESEDGKNPRQPILFKVAAFLKTLTNPSKEGQFFFEKGHILKYMLLEPGEVFKSIIAPAKCVILAGGTMEPLSEFFNTLVPHISTSDIVKFSCEHIIPDDNLNTFIVGGNFEFVFDNREDKSLILELFNFVYELSLRVRSGMVLFFSSYKYLAFVLSIWKEMGLFQKLASVKRIFYETVNSNDVLAEYSDTIQIQQKGAILFAVVGGRLSEGINFENDLARAVIMVGLPYPNLFSGELIVKQRHIKHKIMLKGGSQEDSFVATRELYENICMKAVNQCIGRGIRHANDYANIYLIDKRYSTERIKNKLSNWIRKRIQPDTSIPSILTKTAIFFDKKSKL